MPFVLPVLAASAIGFQASSPSPSTPERLRLVSKVGQRFEYSMKLGMTVHRSDPGAPEGQVNTVAASWTMAERVIRIADGAISMRRFRSDHVVEGRGEIGEGIAKGMRANGAPNSLLTLNSRNQPLQEGGGRPADNGVGLLFPESPVQVGDTWEGPYNRTAKLQYTLRGFAPVGTRRVALIDVAAAKGTDATFLVAPESRFAVDVADGRVLRSRAGFTLVSPNARFEMTFETIRTGAPEWPVILAPFGSASESR